MAKRRTIPVDDSTAERVRQTSDLIDAVERLRDLSARLHGILLGSVTSEGRDTQRHYAVTVEGYARTLADRHARVQACLGLYVGSMLAESRYG